MIEPAEPDVVGPAVAADDPDALADERVGDGEQVPCLAVLARLESSLQLGDALALVGEMRLLVLRRVEDRARELLADRPGQTLEHGAGERHLVVQREPHPEPELRVVLEQRVRPGGSAAVRVA